MTAAQIKLVKNVIRMGNTLRMFWEKETGAKYTVRYSFGSLSGTAAEGLTAGTLEWVLDSEIFSAEMTGNTMDGILYLDTYNTVGSLLGTTQVDFTVADTYILIPYLPDYVNVGETIRISVSSSNWTYRPKSTALKYNCGNASGSIYLSASGYLPTYWYKDWSVPLSLAKEFPADTSFYMEIPLETEYQNLISGTTSVIGSVVYRLEVRVPDNDDTKPKLTMTTGAESTLDDAFDGLYIRGKSRVRVKLEASSNASEIAAQTIQVGSEMVVGSEGSFELTGNTMTVRGIVTDKRGYGRMATETINAMAYSSPGVVPVEGRAKIICARCLSDGTPSQKGEFLLIQARRRYTTIESGGKQLNKCVLRYRIRTAGGDFSDWVELLSENASGSEYNGVVSGVVLSAKTGYSVQIGVADTIGEFHNVTVPIPASGVPFHVGRGNRNVSVGGYCDYSRMDVFDVYFTQYFFTGAKALSVFEGGNWGNGTELGAAVPGADLAGIGTYNLLIAVADGNPVLLVKAGDKIAGGNIQIQYAMNDGVDYLTLQSGGPITALYKLL